MSLTAIPNRYRTLAGTLLAAEERNVELLSQRLYSVTEASLGLNVTRATILRWIRQGQIRGAVRTGALGRWRIPSASIATLKGQGV
jgi:excisionase family DNA binding protein